MFEQYVYRFQESVYMKNTLLAVLMISLCYDQTQAQSISPPSPDYIKYQGTHPIQPVGNGSVTVKSLADGVVTTDKLANDLKTSGKMADGVVTSDKLANDIINSLKGMKDALTSNKPVQKSMPPTLSLRLNNAGITDEHAYACHMHEQLSYAQQSQKPRPTYKTRW